MDKITARLRASSLNFTLVMNLYDRLNELPIPLFVGQRMKLPCLAFKLGPLSASRSRSERVFRAQTAALGIVEIKTKEDLSRFDSLYLVHPWIDFLLDRQPVGSVTETTPDAHTDDRFSLMGDLPSFPGPSNITSVAKQTRAFRLVARLRQPFGALLFTPTRQNVAEYRRVFSELLVHTDCHVIPTHSRRAPASSREEYNCYLWTTLSESMCYIPASWGAALVGGACLRQASTRTINV